MTYSDGVSALHGFRTSPPDLAILDVKMPRMDGMELLRRLRERSDTPVIFLTSKDKEIDELCGLQSGADDFIRKPFSQQAPRRHREALFAREPPHALFLVPALSSVVGAFNWCSWRRAMPSLQCIRYVTTSKSEG